MSQLLLQQEGRRLQTHFSQKQPLHLGWLWGAHMAAQEPQSLAQFWQVSPFFG